MPKYVVKSFSELQKLMEKQAKERRKRVIGAIRKAAVRGVKHVRENMPVAFGDLKGATRAVNHLDGAAVEVDAPHAGAVESGSRPHTPPLAPLIAWVKLRGMQGLKSTRELGKLKGTTTFSHARAVANQIRNHTLTDGSDAVAADAPEQIARAIQMAIKKHGTKPHWFMRNAEPFIIAFLQEEIDWAVQDL